MWMTDYIREVKRQMRDVYKFTPSDRSTKHELIFDNIPNGEYPMEIEGKIDRVCIDNSVISCCNFDE